MNLERELFLAAMPQPPTANHWHVGRGASDEILSVHSTFQNALAAAHKRAAVTIGGSSLVLWQCRKEECD